MEKSKRDNLLIIAMLVVATALITFCLPSKNFRNLDYRQGKPWSYPMLKAPFDIPIEYDTITKHRIIDSINVNFVKIYRTDYRVVNKQLNALSRALAIQPETSPAMRQAIVSAVSRIYDNGIVDNDTYDQISRNQLPQVRMLTNKVADLVSTEHMASVREAYADLDTLLPGSQYRSVLSSISIANYLEPNVLYDSVETKKLLDDAYQKALAPRGVVQTGESIIFPGNLVTPQKYMILQTYERMMREREMHPNGINYGILGQLTFVSIIMIVFYIFMKLMRPRTFANLRKMVFLISFDTLFVVMVEIVVAFRPSYLGIIPFALVPIIVTTFCDTRTSFFINMIVVILCSLVADNQAEFIVMQFLAGNIAIVSIKELSRRSQLARCAAYIFLVYSLCFISFQVMHEGNLDSVFTNNNWHPFLKFAINCAVLSFAYILIFLIEKLFGFTSTVTLVELSDINTPVLRELSEACPGTFQHSLQVANLAAEAAHEIGANPQLARAGALYHDIGKIDNPAFFTENQNGVNPHDSLTPDQSARIVINHVADGLKRADKAKLPQVIKDFISQHHGKGRTRYFYTMACKAHPGEVVDPTPYTYPGPNPRTKETAILMMADSCEAAARSLKNPDEKDIANVVNNIIDTQMREGLLNDSPISFNDIGVIKATFIERLRTFYHMRVAYPEEIKPVVRPDVDVDADDDMQLS